MGGSPELAAGVGSSAGPRARGDWAQGVGGDAELESWGVGEHLAGI